MPEMFYTLILVVTQVYVHIKIHQAVCLRCMYLLCKLYFNFRHLNNLHIIKTRAITKSNVFRTIPSYLILIKKTNKKTPSRYKIQYKLKCKNIHGRYLTFYVTKKSTQNL